ncbi:D-alanine--D-alanine ligase [Vallitalea longa]|uniref:D-alanine--D-alanine ligase n=1 Tax=Vallitalea longa TaxID=2936439 RepID=A0A9W5YBG7_9FIRM|nr:D-alanine--D-serine ligase VanG [Vallitalea longa]GKX30044.1 D-alanine--D-alanine ligase [Vallitalea longa]
MEKKKIAILFGGYSSEYNVSLQSANAIIKNLNSELYEKILIGITSNGLWYRFYGNIDEIENDTWHINKNECVPVVISPNRDFGGIIEFTDNKNRFTEIDAAFPVLHGKNGEDGTVQGMIELAGIPLIGCDTLSSSLCMDKNRAHKLVKQAGIDIPDSVIFNKDDNVEYISSEIKHLKYPFFVKPLKAGSSLGITKVNKKEELSEAIDLAFSFDDELIIEENIDGFEVGCAILGNEQLIIGEVDEIELSDGFFDNIEKYTLKSSKIHMPVRIGTTESDKIKKTAAKIYKTLGCKGFARVDMFYDNGRIIFNEVNTIPGFTAHSRYPNMMKGIGLSFSDILDKLIEIGIE